MPARAPQILALGGGGFSMERDSSLLDDYALSLSGAERPRVCFLPTASGDADHYVVRFYRRFSAGCEASHVSLFRRDQGTGGVEDDLATHLLSQDLIYVGGGNVVSMLGAWRAHGLDGVLRRAWRRGIVLCGPSAGSLCWFEQALSAFHGAPRPIRGLGLLPYSNCVHYDAEPARREEYHRSVAEGMRGGFAVEDGVALHFSGTELARVVSSRAGGAAYRVELRPGGGIRETRLAAECLAGDAALDARPGTIAGAPLPERPRAERPRPGRAWPHERRGAERAAADPRDGRRRLHDGAGQPAARRLRALARAVAANRGSSSCRPPRETRPPRSTPSWTASPSAAACTSTSRCSACARPAARCARSSSSRTSSTPAAARCATCSRSGAPTGSTACSWRPGGAAPCSRASARARCAGSTRGITRSSGPPEPLAGLGLLEGSLTVHADGEPERLPVWLSHVRDGTLPGGWALDDGAALLFRGLRLERAVSSRPGAGAERADAIAGELVRRRLPVTLLGEEPRTGLTGEDDAVRELRRVRMLRQGIAGRRE